MDIIDLALRFNDLEWAKELVEQGKLDEGLGDLKKLVTLFDKDSVALERITTQYAVLEKNGVRAFNINSDFDRNEAELVLIENPPYDSGDAVKYYIPTKDELIYMRGTVNGYVFGYREAYRNVNMDHALLSDALNRLDRSRQRGRPKEKKAGNKPSSKSKKANK